MHTLIQPIGWAYFACFHDGYLLSLQCGRALTLLYMNMKLAQCTTSNSWQAGWLDPCPIRQFFHTTKWCNKLYCVQKGFSKSLSCLISQPSPWKLCENWKWNVFFFLGVAYKFKLAAFWHDLQDSGQFWLTPVFDFVNVSEKSYRYIFLENE